MGARIPHYTPWVTVKARHHPPPLQDRMMLHVWAVQGTSIVPTLGPEGCDPGRRHGNALLFARWLSTVYMTLEQLGEAHPCRATENPSWAWIDPSTQPIAAETSQAPGRGNPAPPQTSHSQPFMPLPHSQQQAGGSGSHQGVADPVHGSAEQPADSSHVNPAGSREAGA